jgi:hypothetical protein
VHLIDLFYEDSRPVQGDQHGVIRHVRNVSGCRRGFVAVRSLY